jgi:RPA family protein
MGVEARNLLLGTIVPKLHDYESMTWAEVDGPTGCHFVELGDLVPDAQARLRELEKDEQDRLFSVRITGKLRIWGIRDLAILRVLWCDQEHEVCPAPKKNTCELLRSAYTRAASAVGLS